MTTKVTPTDTESEEWNFGEGSSEVRNRKRPRRKTNDAQLEISHHRQADYPLKLLIKLPVADAQIQARHPCGSANGAVNVSLFVLVKKLRTIDPKSSSANLSFILSLRWACPNLMGHRVDVSKLWVPKIGILNKDNMTTTADKPWFYPLTGDVRQIIHCEGTVANKSDLQSFPFDYDTVSIQIAAEIGTGDRYVRLRWQDDTATATNSNNGGKGGSGSAQKLLPRSASSVTPAYVGELHMEWQLLQGGNKVKRMDKRLHVNGNFSAVEVQLSLTRKYGFYLWKIMLLVWMIAIMSWSTFLIRDVDGRIDDTEVFVMRLEFTAALLLAAVSFLYISQESIPRLSYLTSLDLMLLFSFFNLFMVVIETVGVRIISQRSLATGSFFFKAFNGSSGADVVKQGAVLMNDYYYNTDTIVSCDIYAMIIYPIVFHCVELTIPLIALVKRKRWVQNLKKGLDGEVDVGLSCNTWEEEWKWMKSQKKGKHQQHMIQRSMSGRPEIDRNAVMMGDKEIEQNSRANLFAGAGSNRGVPEPPVVPKSKKEDAVRKGVDL